MNTLEKIIAHKRIEVKERESLYPIELLKQSNYFKSPTVSLSSYLKRHGRACAKTPLSTTTFSRALSNEIP